MTYFAYIHARPDTTEQSGIFYVGKGKGRRHLNLIDRSLYHKHVIDKHGKENILIGKLDCSSEEIAFELEKGLIKCLRRSGVELTNMTDGGEGASGCKHEGDSWDKHRAALKRINEELTFEKRSDAIKSYFAKFEKYESPQAKQFMKMATDPEINKIRSEKSTAANLANWQDEEVRNKRVAGMKGKKKTMTPAAIESRRKNAQSYWAKVKAAKINLKD